MTRLVHLAWLVALWLALWGEISVANVVAGIVVALAVGALAGTRRSGQIVVRPLHVLRFACYFAFKLVEASLIVAREVLARRRRIRTGIVAVPLHGCSDAVVTLIADSISLTPGTLTVEVTTEPQTLFVHVLHLRDVEQVRRDVRRLEVLVVRAFGTADALAGLTEDDTRAVENT